MLPLFKDQRKRWVERRGLGITTRGFEIPTGFLCSGRLCVTARDVPPHNRWQLSQVYCSTG